MERHVYVTSDQSNRDSNKVYHSYGDCGHVKRIQQVGKHFERVSLSDAKNMGRVRECQSCENRRL